MIGLNVLLWVFIAIFAIIGYVRGGAKESLVTSAVILGLYMVTIFEKYIPFVKEIASHQDTTILLIRLLIVGVLVLLGYQTPNYPRAATGKRFSRESPQDKILGFVIGALNGYLIFGTAWYYLYNAGYPIAVIIAPTPGSPLAAITKSMVEYLPPAVLGEPFIYFAVAIPLFIIIAIFL